MKVIDDHFRKKLDATYLDGPADIIKNEICDRYRGGGGNDPPADGLQYTAEMRLLAW